MNTQSIGIQLVSYYKAIWMTDTFIIFIVLFFNVNVLIVIGESVNTNIPSMRYNFEIFAVASTGFTVATCYYSAYKKFKWFTMRINVIV